MSGKTARRARKNIAKSPNKSDDDVQEFKFTDVDAQEVADRLRKSGLSEEYVDTVLGSTATLIDASFEITNNWVLIAERFRVALNRMLPSITKDMVNFGVKRRDARRLASVIVDFSCHYTEQTAMRLMLKKLMPLVLDGDIESEDGEFSLMAFPLTDITV